MNKWTLTFISSSIEKAYMMERHSIIRPTLQYSLIVMIVLCLMLIINYIANELWMEALATLGFIFICGSLYIISSCLQTHQWSLTILNILIAFALLSTSTQKESHYIFLRGANFVLTHTIILFASDFIHAASQIVAIVIIYLAITITSTTYFAYDVIIYMILCSIALIIILFRMNRSQRISFLSGLKDSQWECTLSNVIEERFYMFTYNQNKVKFELKLTNHHKGSQLKDEESLFLRFLRQYKTGSKTLEQVLFQRIVQKHNITNPQTKMHMAIRNQYIQHNIIYSEMNVPDQLFLIIFQSSDYQEEIKKKLINTIQSTQFQYKQVLTELGRLAQLGLVSSSIKYLSKILWLSQNVLSAYQVQKPTIEQVDLQQLLQAAIEIFNHAQAKVKVQLVVQGQPANIEQPENIQFQNPLAYFITAQQTQVSNYVMQLLQSIYQCTRQNDGVKVKLYWGQDCDEFFLQVHNVNVIQFIRVVKEKKFSKLVDRFNQNMIEYSANNVIFKFRLDQ